jgi:hypothetical protein
MNFLSVLFSSFRKVYEKKERLKEQESGHSLSAIRVYIYMCVCVTPRSRANGSLFVSFSFFFYVGRMRQKRNERIREKKKVHRISDYAKKEKPSEVSLFLALIS